jgi:hypothetical protein
MYESVHAWDWYKVLASNCKSHLIQVGGEDKTIDFTFHDYTA